MFRQMDLKGQTQADTQLKTTHQNTISTIRAYEESNGSVRKFSSKDAPTIYPNRVIGTDIPGSERSRRPCGHLVHLNLSAILWCKCDP